MKIYLPEGMYAALLMMEDRQYTNFSKVQDKLQYRGQYGVIDIISVPDEDLVEEIPIITKVYKKDLKLGIATKEEL